MEKKKLIEFLEDERKNVGYGDGLEEPDILQEVMADFYETKASAWYAGWDNCIERVLTYVHEN